MNTPVSINRTVKPMPMTRKGLTRLEAALGAAEVVHRRFRDPRAPGHPWRDIGLWHPRLANCQWWAASQQRRHGGYVTLRRSVVPWRWHKGGRDHEAFWSHALWSPDGETCWEYTTDKPEWLPIWRLPLMLLFAGRVELVTRQWP